jgi:hypothetical protein
MWSLDSFCGYSCYPLFLLTAWFRSSRQLSRRLRFKLPLSLQLGLREIRAFWAGELVIGSLAFVFLMGLAKPLPGWAMEKLPGLRVDAAYSNFALPLAALALGLAWPNLASFSLGVGSRKYALSLAALRDHVLGGAAIEAINRRLELEVASYIDRVIDAAKVDPEDTGAGIVQTLDLNLKGAKLNEPAALGEVTEALSRLARSDFASLFLRISQVRMIPLVDRPKPLMRVPDMTSHEEERLYQAELSTPWALARKAVRPIPGIDERRLQVLRTNARRLIRQRVRAAATVTALATAVVFSGVAYGQRFVEGDHSVSSEATAPAGLSAPAPEAYPRGSVSDGELPSPLSHKTGGKEDGA